MEIKINNENETTSLEISGSIDSSTSNQLETSINEIIDDAKNLILDFEQVDYISSAGLRVVLATMKKLKEKEGALKIVNASPVVKEVFEMTGFSSFIDIN